MVLGASGSCGAAVSRMLAREGAGVALGGRSRQKLEALEEEIRDLGWRALVVGTHLAKRHHLLHLMEAAAESFGGVDILLFMAGVDAPSLRSLDVSGWEESVDVNIKGFLYSLAALPLMREGGGGRVICFSMGDTDPLRTAAQNVLRALLRELVQEFRDQNIRAGEVFVSDPRCTDPERCAEATHRLLTDGKGEADLQFRRIHG